MRAPTQFVKEGEVELEVPELELFRTASGDYAPSLAPVFYNPRMELCRDISVSALQVLADELGSALVCDPLAGVGARGLRYAKEVGGVAKVVLNDRSRRALEFVERNVELNGLARLVEVRNEDANVLLWSYGPKFHFIDLDPFGSPAPLIDAACSALADGGILALTATDAAPLCGAHPKSCLRKYGARPLRTEYSHELGLRILIGSCQRAAGKHGLALRPVLAHSTMHYFRAYLRAWRGARLADDVLKGQGYISHCFSCGDRAPTFGIASELPGPCRCGGRFDHAGPLWLGPLGEKGFIGRAAADLAGRGFKQGRRELALLSRCAEEVGGPPTFFDLHKLSRREGISPPKLEKVVARLSKAGFFVSRTHFSDLGIRTDAPLDVVVDALKH